MVSESHKQNPRKRFQKERQVSMVKIKVKKSAWVEKCGILLESMISRRCTSEHCNFRVIPVKIEVSHAKRLKARNFSVTARRNPVKWNVGTSAVRT